MKTRIEIHLTEEETAKLDKIAEQEGRSRKNLCETEIRKLIKREGKKK
jgi:predicted transcriptional regulator